MSRLSVRMLYRDQTTHRLLTVTHVFYTRIYRVAIVLFSAAARVRSRYLFTEQEVNELVS